jgi:hypothetical protein
METEQGYEQQAYEVQGRQLGWRVSQLQQQGLPYNVQSRGGGVYIVIVQQPSGADPFAYQAPPAPRTRPRSGPRSVPVNVKVAAIVVVLGMIGYGAYVVAGGRSAIPDVVPGGYRVLWGNIMDVIGGTLMIFLAMLVFWLARSVAPTLMAKLRRRP